MGAILTMSIDPATDNPSPSIPQPYEVRVVWQGGCVLLYGSVPVSFWLLMAKSMPKGSVQSIDLANLTEANTVFGLPRDVEALRAALIPAKIEQLKLAPYTKHLSLDAITWLAAGSRGASSNAIFYQITRYNPNRSGGDLKAHPHDADDFRRCLLLLKQVPALAEKLNEMQDVSPQWSALVNSWTAITRCFESEAPNWETPKIGDSWKRTNNLIKAVLDGTK